MRNEKLGVMCLPLPIAHYPLPFEKNPPLFAQLDEQKSSPLKEFTVLPVGISVGKRNTIPSALVKGAENGSEAVNLSNWLISFDDVVKALQLTIDKQDDKNWKITAPGLVTKIDSTQLINDNDLGLAITVQQIETWFKVPTEFDALEYAIVLNPPWLGIQSGSSYQEIPIITEGLPRVSPPAFSFTALGNRINFSGTQSSNNTSYSNQGELTAIGTLLGGGWVIKANQSDFLNTTKWNIQDAQWWYQSDRSDYIIGSQPTFWQGDGIGSYWGLTTIQRWGFIPEKNTIGSTFTPSQRLQANNVPRSIRGEAKAGTLAQLVEGFGSRIVAENLVDESGIYSFEKIPSRGVFYQVRLYADGLLSNEPLIKDIKFTDIPELLPKGASVLTVSAGARRQQQGDNLFGDFKQIGAGISYRYGLFEDISLGVGFYHDNQSFRTLGEIFYQPNQIPLRLSISALSGDFDSPWVLRSRLDYNPNSNFNISIDGDRFGQRMNLNWRITPNINFTTTANYDDIDPYISTGLGIFFGGTNSSTSIRGEISTNNTFNWNLSHRVGSLNIEHRGTEDNTQSEISYNLSGKSYFSDGHSLTLNYDTTNNNEKDNLGMLRWRYRSIKRLNDGLPLWEFNLGYGIGSRGSGILSSLSTGVIPGVTLRLGYQQVSLNSGDDRFIIDLFPRLNLQNGIKTGSSERDFENLLTQGGLWIKPFYDKNGNNIFDGKDEIFTQDVNLMLVLNNRPINTARPEIKPHGVFVIVPTGVYRLDLDPAGFPFDWSPTVSALAVQVVAGSYTEVNIPFVRSYTVAGNLKNKEGKPVGGAKIEAIPEDGTKTISSITNGAGLFFLEGLKQGKYLLKINNQPAKPSELIINEKSESLQEINLSI